MATAGFFLTGLLVFTLGSTACGLSGSFVALVAARAVQALGAAMLMPSSLALLLAAFPAGRRAAAVSTWSAIAAMAAALGPPVGGFLIELSWRWIFFVNVPVALLALVAGLLVLAKTPGTGSGIPDLFGALTLVVGVGALVWALIDLPDGGWHAATVVLPGIGAGCAIAFAVWRSLHHPSPAVDLAAIRVLPMWSSCLALLLFSAAHGAMLLGGVMLLTTVWGMPPAIAGLCLAPGPIVVVVVSLTLAGRLIDKLGIAVVASTGAALYLVGIVIWLCTIRSGSGLLHRLPTSATVYRRRRGTGDAEPFRRHGCGAAVAPLGRRLGSDEYRAATGHGAGHHGPDNDLPTRRRPRCGAAGMGVRRNSRGQRRGHRGRNGTPVERCPHRVTPTSRSPMRWRAC